jgi:maltose alpha-D-glucosyltransferase/alpha-amylase
MKRTESQLDDNPLWYRDAVIYQLHIKAFADSDGNGIGDFRGLIDRLDYLQQLGITAVWLLPFYPSPLKDDGYDIADYFKVNPHYHSLKEFREFLRAAHARGIRVITELVLNHTSDQHPWFQRARRARPGSAYRDFYVWSDTPEKYREARIIFQDFETSNWSWDPVARAYYWHRFYSHQPDLNFDNPLVQSEMLRVIDFWLRMGVDGLRLDAVPYLYERDGTNCENLPETHAFLKKLRAHMDVSFKNRMLLSEANQWPEDAAAYFGDGDETHMSFHFPLMPRMFMAIQMEDRFPIIDILDQTPAIPESCQWATFLRNHDELTLEMVTDEERDYMYRAYASDPQARINLGIRRRLAPLMGNDRRKIELMNILLLSLPGTPIIYYGDEIGMGDNYYLGDRNGVRTPMQWSPDRNAGFSRANPQKLFLPVIIEPEYHFEAVNVETQERYPSSLLWWMRRAIAMRKRFRAFGRGGVEMLQSENPKVLAFIRFDGEEKVLVVVNLSRFSQAVTVDLSRYAGMVPEEVFSRNRFPTIRETRYLFTLGPYDFFWFELRSGAEEVGLPGEVARLRVKEGSPWWEMLKGREGDRFFDRVVPGYLQRVRWFRSKGQSITQVRLVDVCHLKWERRVFLLLFIEVAYTGEDTETYLLPLAWLPLDSAQLLAGKTPQAAIAPLDVGNEEGFLCDAVYEEDFREILYGLIAGRRKVRGEKGCELSGHHGGMYRKLAPAGEEVPSSRVVSAEQSNSSILFGDRFIFKLYRKIEDGINPEPEILRFLTEKARFRHAPAYAGSLDYGCAGREPIIFGMLQQQVESHGDAWKNTLDVLSRFIERLLSRKQELPPLPDTLPTLLEAAETGIPPEYTELLRGFHLEMVALLGLRTAEMHCALAAGGSDPAWRMEEYSTLYQRSLYQSMRSLVRRNLQLLSRNTERLAEDDLALAELVLDREEDILACLQQITGHRIAAMKCRIHGDFHLGQALFTGKDFVFIDFEGEPARTLGERRLKRSPLRDVAGMIRSFHYAAMTSLFDHGAGHPGDIPFLEPWLDAWYVYVSGAYLNAYLQRMAQSALIPSDRRDLEVMLHAFILEKSIYELGYEVNNRPDWIRIPLRGICGILEEEFAGD